MKLRICCACAVLVVLPLAHSRGDELSQIFGSPEGVFKNVNSTGGVALTESIGTFVTTKGMSIPLTISFDSSSTLVSPFLGLGWSIPLLESRAVLEDPTTLGFLLPGGKPLYLAQAKDLSFTSLDGKWTATVVGDDIKLVVPNGWTLSYHQGHLVKIDLQDNNALTVDYDDQGATAHFNGLVIFSASKKGQIQIADKYLTFALADRPLLQQLNGSPVVSRLVPSLASIEGDSLSKRTWHYSLDPSMNEVLTDSEAGNFTWNPISGTILTDKDWTYEVSSTYKVLEPVVSIQRHNASGKKESYTRDDIKGIMTKTFADGTVTKTAFFTSSGKFYGLPRTIETDKGDAKVSVTKLDYDPSGNLIRKIDQPGSELDYTYDALNHLVSFTKDSKVYVKREYDKDGKLTSCDFPQKHWTYALQYLPNDEVYLTLTDSATGKVILATKTTQKFINSSLNAVEYGNNQHS